MNPRDDIHHLKGFGGKKECEYPCDHYNTSTTTITTTTSLPRIITSSSRQWSSSFKNPRIVRVSRAFGGKDRHSKVCTVRGLRDRRIRLSVPTAIQLYDLQDRLGLSQPSKVVDWLIEAAKLDIDKLPPLPTLPSHFPPHPLEAINKQYGHDQDEGFGGFLPPHLSAQNFFPLNTTQLCVPNYNFHWDQLGGGGGYSLATPTDHQETTSSSSSSSHLYLYPSAPTLPSITPAAFPSYIPQSMENHDHLRQILNLSTSQMNKAAAFSLSMDSKIFYSTEEREDKFLKK